MQKQMLRPNSLKIQLMLSKKHFQRSNLGITLSNYFRKRTDIFYTPKSFKDMKFVAYSSTVFKVFIADFKTLVSSLEKLPDGHTFKNKILDRKFLLSILFLFDVTNLMATASKLVQISSSLPWNCSKNIDHLLVQINIMFQHVSLI